MTCWRRACSRKCPSTSGRCTPTPATTALARSARCGCARCSARPKSLRNGITTIQDFLTRGAAGRRHRRHRAVGLRGGRRARGVRGRGARQGRARHRAVHSEGPAGIDPQEARGRRPHREKRARLRRRTDQAARPQADAAPDLGAGAVGAAALLAGTARRHGGAVARARASGVHACLRNTHPGRGSARADRLLAADVAGGRRADERAAQSRSRRLADRRRYRAVCRRGRARRAQSDQQSQAQERRRADSRPASGRRRSGAGLRQLQLRRDAEHLHRDADAVPAAGSDRSGARPDRRRLCVAGRDAERRAGSRPRRQGRRAQARHGGRPRDPRSQRAGVRAVQQRGAADRVRRMRPRGRDRVRRRTAGGARRQARHARRSGARGRSRGDFTGVPPRCRGAGQPQQRPDCAAARRQPRRMAGSARLRTLHRTRKER